VIFVFFCFDFVQRKYRFASPKRFTLNYQPYGVVVKGCSPKILEGQIENKTEFLHHTRFMILRSRSSWKLAKLFLAVRQNFLVLSLTNFDENYSCILLFCEILAMVHKFRGDFVEYILTEA